MPNHKKMEIKNIGETLEISTYQDVTGLKHVDLEIIEGYPTGYSYFSLTLEQFKKIMEFVLK